MQRKSYFVRKRSNECKFLNCYSDWRGGKVLFTLSASFRIINTNQSLGIKKNTYSSLVLEEISPECATNLANTFMLQFGGKGD